MSKLSARLVLPMAFVLCAVMAALAADAPRLEIQSPKDGSTINSGAVMIKFKTDHFKVISLKNEANAPAANPAMSENAPMSASQPSPGMGPSAGGPGAATTTSPNQPPSNDTVAMQKPDTSGMPANQQSMPQGEANAANAREGHIHVFVDDTPWLFVHSDSDPIVLAGLQPGQHKVKLQLVGANHMPTGAEQTVNFTVAPRTR